MGERHRLRLVFGGGIDLETGALSVPESSFEDLVNFTPRVDKIIRRGGYKATATLIADKQGTLLDQPGDCVLGVFPFRAEGAGIAVAYQASTKNVVINRVSGTGSNPTFVDVWFTLDERAEFPPRIHAAESYGKLFFAHDEVGRMLRAPTVYYDRGTGGLHPLTAVLRDGAVGDPKGDGSGEPVYFRGVTTYLSYLIGWGFGHAEDEGTEIVRVSEPGEPTKFEMNAYWVAGQRGDPVLACVPLSNSVAVLKGAAKYGIIGTSFADFGILQSEELFGIASSRLAVTVGGYAYVWSLSGPRIHTGLGPSIGIELPLGFKFPSEADLRNAFATYDPRERVVLFVFGDVAYALSIVDPQNPRWTKYEYGHAMATGGILFPAGYLPEGVSPGYAEIVSAADTDADPDNPISTRRVEVAWYNRDAVGVELVEIYLREYDAEEEEWGEWEQYKQIDGYFPIGPSPEPQRYPIRGLKSGTKYEVALRLRVGNTYRQGYEPQTDPSDWPDVEARKEFVTSAIAPGTPDVVWKRIDQDTAVMEVEWDSGDPTLPVRVLWSYDGVTWLPFATAEADEKSATGELDEIGMPERESYVYFALEHYSAVLEAGARSGAVHLWTGPIAPVVTSLEPTSAEVDGYEIHWANLLPSAYTEIEDNASGTMSPVPFSPFSPGTTSYTRSYISPQPGSELMIRLRYALPIPGSSEKDYSDWTVETIEVPDRDDPIPDDPED